MLLTRISQIKIEKLRINKSILHKLNNILYFILYEQQNVTDLIKIHSIKKRCL